MTTSSPDPFVGRTIGQYQILARIGSGGMGVVYTARDARLGRTVALKFLPPQWSHDATAKERFVREAQAASATNHPNICTIHDIETADDGQLFIVMAYYEGRTLKTRLDSGRLPIEEALDLATQVADGLAKAHAQSVVHRDIKPGNVILTEDGVRILDFGLATFADALKLTVENAPLGTVAYMSPEQVRGQQADARADVWATGAVLYEMLTGHPPFRGSHAEAIGYAVRNEQPTPIRDERPEVPEEVEQLVFRALHKEPNVRYASGRELARALRQVRGQTVPQDLRTATLQRPDVADRAPAPRPVVRRIAYAASAVAVATTLTVAYLLFAPIERERIIIAPVVNQTGSPELDSYRLALTYELVEHLVDSSIVGVVPYRRVLPLIRRYRGSGGDVSSLASIASLGRYGGADTVVLPTLLYEDHRWKARVDVSQARTGVQIATYETESLVSSLATQTAEALMTAVAERIEHHFAAARPLRVRISDRLRGLRARATSGEGRPPASLDAAAAFEQGLNAYGLQEYAAAVRFFTMAADEDGSDPLVHAWRSRALHAMRHETDAIQAADSALRNLTDRTSSIERLLVQAIAAESRRDVKTAEAQYRALAAPERADADATWELGAFLDRQARNDEALQTFLRVVSLEPALHAEVDVCRLYNRLGQSLKAREWAERARNALREMGAAGEEGQAMLCLADALRSGTAAELEAARDAIARALDLFDGIGADYNVPRAYNYLATLAGMQHRRSEALAFGERALATARQAGNTVIQPLVLMNLGVTSNALGHRGQALDYYQQSAAAFRALGDAGRAAEIQANRGALVIEYGANPDEGLRDVGNALEVARSQHNDDFEAFCLYVVGGYYRQAGRQKEATRYLAQALSIARRYHFDDKIALASIREGRVAFDAADYPTAARWLDEAVHTKSDSETTTQSLLHLARARTRMGAFPAAQSAVTQVSRARAQDDSNLDVLWHFVQGEMAYETNRAAEALTHFEEAGRAWTDSTPDSASVEGHAYAGLLRVLAGQADGRHAVEACRSYGSTTGRFVLYGRCSVLLARIDVEAHQFRSALATLDAVPADDDTRALGDELQAQRHYWRGRALAGIGRAAQAGDEERLARALLQHVRAVIPMEMQSSFDSRPDIRRILK